MPLAQQLIDGLRRIPQLQVQGITNSNRLDERVPTVLVTHPGLPQQHVAGRALGEQGINVRLGDNYALEVVRHLGLDESEGVLRIGLAHYNTAAEVDRIVVDEGILAGVGSELHPG